MATETQLSLPTLDDQLKALEDSVNAFAPSAPGDYIGDLGAAYLSLVVATRNFKTRLLERAPGSARAMFRAPQVTQIRVAGDSAPPPQSIPIQHKAKPTVVGMRGVLKHLKTSGQTLYRLLDKTDFPKIMKEGSTRVWFDLDQVDAWMENNPKSLLMARHDLF